MYDDIDVIELAGGFRAVIMAPDYAEQPDGDGYGIILRFTDSGRWNGRTVDVVHADGGRSGMAAAGELAGRIATALDMANGYGDDADAAAERAMMRAGIVDWHYFRSGVDRSGDEYLCLVSDESWPGGAESAAADWQAWLDGDVYDVAVQARSIGTVHPDAVFYVGSETFDRWDDVERVGGYYGRDWAEQAAREMFAGYVGTAAV